MGRDEEENPLHFVSSQSPFVPQSRLAVVSAASSNQTQADRGCVCEKQRRWRCGVAVGARGSCSLHGGRWKGATGTLAYEMWKRGRSHACRAAQMGGVGRAAPVQREVQLQDAMLGQGWPGELCAPLELCTESGAGREQLGVKQCCGRTCGVQASGLQKQGEWRVHGTARSGACDLELAISDLATGGGHRQGHGFSGCTNAG